MDVEGRRVTLMGLGRHGGGVGAARFLARHGALLTITDRAAAELLNDSISALDDFPDIRWRLGGHDDSDFRNADLIVVNPAVLPDDPFVAVARQVGIPITTEIELFLERCPARVAAVTGSNGKSSTAAMLAGILSAAGRRVWLGGNIGRSLLDDLSTISPADDIVLELSSFQLSRLSTTARGVDLAIVTNCSPNHLDWHGTYDEYRHAKQRLLRMQSAHSAVVLNVDDKEVAGWRGLVRGTLIEPIDDRKIPRLAVPGKHQRANARLAAAAANAWGASDVAIALGLRNFAGLPHRLERVGEIAGRAFYNDSLSTTPESTIAALTTFDQPIWLLAGGYDKGADIAALADAIVAHATGVACYGAVGERLLEAVKAHDPQFASTRVDTLKQAVQWCWSRSHRGDVVLLSPAFASYDQFRDYADRAAHFREQVQSIEVDSPSTLASLNVVR